MILRRFGSKVAAVEPHFDARALTEIAFRRAEGPEMESSEFDAGWERTGGRELAPTAEGDVQGEVEEELLRRLRSGLEEMGSELAADQVLLIENERGVDHPKTRERRRNVIVDGENRFHFEWRVDPPLRVGVYSRRKGSS